MRRKGKAGVTGSLTRNPRGAITRGGQGRIRTCVGTRPPDLQSGAIDHSATYPRKCFNVLRFVWGPHQALPDGVKGHAG